MIWADWNDLQPTPKVDLSIKHGGFELISVIPASKFAFWADLPTHK
jgi:hypothetical protein